MDKNTVYGLGMIALAMQVGAVATDFWSVKKVKNGPANVKLNMGLWKACAVGKDGDVSAKKCLHLPVTSDVEFPRNSLYAVRVFSILSCVILAMALSCMYTNRCGAKTMANLLILATLCALGGCLIWAIEFHKIKTNMNIRGTPDTPTVNFNMGPSFFISLVAGLVMVSVSYSYMNR